MIHKVTDTFNDGLSPADNVFTDQETKRFYRLFRKNGILPHGFARTGKNSELTTEKFKLRGLQFGNWLSTADKYDYLSAFYIGMEDLNKVLRFKGLNMGFDGQLGICFGSRGIPNAKAHFHSGQMIINLSRYFDNDKLKGDFDKETRFLGTGGIGSLAHEYGHFLDGIVGARLEPTLAFFLSGPAKSVNWKQPVPDKSIHPMRYQMRKVLDTALFDKKGEFTTYGKRLREIPQKYNGDYYRQNIEIFARLFETYICFELRKKDIENWFLTKKNTVYNSNIIYPNNKEMIPIAREMNKLMAMIRSKVK